MYDILSLFRCFVSTFIRTTTTLRQFLAWSWRLLAMTAGHDAEHLPLDVRRRELKDERLNMLSLGTQEC